MVMLDGLYHLGTETAIHLNYMLVKISLIFLILFLTTYWVGKGKNQGIFACILGPVIFYIYYLFADATLNRDHFIIDDSFGYIFLHILVFFIAYFTMYYILTLNKGNKDIRNGAIAFMLAIGTFGLDSFYKMALVQIKTSNEELVATALDFSQSIYLVMFLIVIYFLILTYITNPKYKTLTYLLGSVAGIFIISRDIPRSVVGIFSSLIPLYLMLKYLKDNQQIQLPSNGKKFLIATIAFTIIGSIYTFLNYKTIKAIGFGLQHNDHIMIGTLSLTIAVVALYKFLYQKNNGHHALHI